MFVPSEAAPDRGVELWSESAFLKIAGPLGNVQVREWFVPCNNDG